MKHLFIFYNTLKANFTSKAIAALKLSFIGQIDKSICKKHMNFEIYRIVVQILCILTLTDVLLILLSEDANIGVYFFNQTKVPGPFIMHQLILECKYHSQKICVKFHHLRKGSFQGEQQYSAACLKML